MSDIHSWTANHFTISELDGNVPRLLRRVATAISRLGEIDIHDVTFCGELDSEEYRVTVYFNYSPIDTA